MKIIIKRIAPILGIALFLFCFVSQSSATIISGTGWSVNTIDPLNDHAVTTGGVQQTRDILAAVPTDLGMDTYFNTQQQGLNEKQNYTLTKNLKLNKDVTINSGVTISSHLIFFNHADGVGDNIEYSFADFGVEWVFDSIILGITYDPNGVWEYKSSYLGLDNVDYGYDDYYDESGRKVFLGRGLEDRRDSYTISGNTLTLNSFVQQPGDYVRVITASPVPEPTTSILFGFGMLLISGMIRKQRRG